MNKTYDVTITRNQLHDICHAAIVASLHFTNLEREAIETGAPMAMRVGYRANRDYFVALYDKFHAIRCEDEILVK